MKQPLDQQWDERFKQFSLRISHEFYLLPARHSLIVDRLLGMIVLVNWQDEQIVSVGEELNDEQFTLALTLLERWPSYTPYEILLGQLGIQLTGQDIEDLELLRTIRRANVSEEEQAQEAQARARLQPALQTLRDLLRDCRIYLQSFGVDIGTVVDYGPLLVRYMLSKTPHAEAGAAE